MVAIWTGAIDITGSESGIRDVVLTGSETTVNYLSQSSSTLKYLSLVEVALIPLYLIVGPSTTLTSTDQTSLKWLLSSLGCNTAEDSQDGTLQDSWWKGTFKQSPRGLLLQVNGGKRDGIIHSVTELLVYATVDTDPTVTPSHPKSDSPQTQHCNTNSTGAAVNPPNFKFYALPLSSDRLNYVQRASGLCTPPPEDGEARFLPESMEQLESSIKRRKISSVLDAATTQRRKSKAKGGEGIAKTMAGLERSNSSQTQALLPQPLQSTAQPVERKRPQRAPLDRASSAPSATLGLHESRPASRSAKTATKRSSLHRVESAYSAREGSVISESNNEILEQNKSQLAKMIMTGMRLHGLQQRKRPNTGISRPSHSRGSSAVPPIAEQPGGDDEYKLVYHQTHRAVMFAFRAHCNTKVISQDTMRDVVDQMLHLFCTDPLIASPPIDSFVVGKAEENPFDPPSSSAPLGESQVWCTPLTKKRKIVDSFDAG